MGRITYNFPASLLRGSDSDSDTNTVVKTPTDLLAPARKKQFRKKKASDFDHHRSPIITRSRSRSVLHIAARGRNSE